MKKLTPPIAVKLRFKTSLISICRGSALRLPFYLNVDKNKIIYYLFMIIYDFNHLYRLFRAEVNPAPTPECIDIVAFLIT